MAKRKAPTQLGLGLVASALRPMSPSKRELLRRAGTTLSIQQQRTAKRQAREDEAEDVERIVDSALVARDIDKMIAEHGIPMPRLKRMS